MTRDEFTRVVRELIGQSVFEDVRPESNAQLRINPESLEAAVVSDADFLSEIADNEEAVEEAAAAERSENEDAADWQASQNPDFYPVATLVKSDGKGGYEVDSEAVANLVDTYFAK